MKSNTKKHIDFKYTRIGTQIIMPLSTWRRIISYLRKHGIDSQETTNKKRKVS